MKSTGLFFVLFLMTTTAAFGQVRFGIKGGMTSFDFNPSTISIGDPTAVDQFKLELQDAHYGFTGGVFLDMVFGMFVINPEVSLSSLSVDYKFKEIGLSNFDSIRKESYTHLNMPLLLGLNLGFIQLKAGPVGHYFLESESEILDFAGYEQKFDEFTWGLQGALSIKLGSVVLDLRYEKNQHNFGDHLSFDGVEYDFDKKNTRYIATIGFLF